VRSPVGRANEVRDRLVSLYGKAAKLPVVRGRVAHNILFLSVAPAEAHPPIKQALRDFVASCDKAELINMCSRKVSSASGWAGRSPLQLGMTGCGRLRSPLGTRLQF